MPRMLLLSNCDVCLEVPIWKLYLLPGNGNWPPISLCNKNIFKRIGLLAVNDIKLFAHSVIIISIFVGTAVPVGICIIQSIMMFLPNISVKWTGKHIAGTFGSIGAALVILFNNCCYWSVCIIKEDRRNIGTAAIALIYTTGIAYSKSAPDLLNCAGIIIRW